MKKVALSVMGLMLVAALSISCDTTTTTNSNVANGNRSVVTNGNANTVANTNANTNANTRQAPSREDVDKNRARYEKEAKDAGRKIGAGANDMWLWTKTRWELTTADDLRDSTINVDVDNGVVTLSGTVASAEQKTKAETLAKGVEGVTSVKNDLKVSASGGNTNAANTNPKKS
jgi:hyperosmotically inducible periplasmic protein